MMKKLLLLLCTTGFLFSGCDKSEEYGESKPYRTYLLESYIYPEQLQIRFVNSWKFVFTGKEYSLNSPDPADRMEYLRLAEKHGGRVDRKIGWYLWASFVGLAEEISSIDVRADFAWDDKHSAGSSLNDICIIYGYSCANFLRTGNAALGSCPIEFKLKDLKAGDLFAVIGDSLRLGCPSPATGYDSDGQKMTITITTESGRTITGSYQFGQNQ